VSNSGDTNPGSASGTSTGRRSVTTRGDVDGSTNDSVALRSTGGVESEDLYKPTTQPYKVIGPEDLLRKRLMDMTFGLLAGVLFIGMVALFILALNGAPTDPLVDLMKTALPYIFSLAGIGVGYYFGRQTSKKLDK